MAECPGTCAATRRGARAGAFLALLVGSGLACAPSEPPVVEAGTGVVSFDPVDDGRTLKVVCGSQGGQHIWVSLRTMDTGTRLQRATVGIERPDGTSVCGVTLNVVDLVPAGDALGGALTGLICFIQDPAAIDGVPLVLHAEIVDAWGRTASDRRGIVGRAPDPPCH